MEQNLPANRLHDKVIRYDKTESIISGIFLIIAGALLVPGAKRFCQEQHLQNWTAASCRGRIPCRTRILQKLRNDSLFP